MYIIIGGAYNGKRAYVEKRFSPTSYWEGQLPPIPNNGEQVFAIGRFEQMVQQRIDEEEDSIVAAISAHIQQLANVATCICICTDMSRGVVPIDAQQRKMRDCVGRLYQQLCAQNAEVVRIWYGIPQLLKEKRHE